MKYLVTQFRLLVCSLLIRWCVSIAPTDDAEGLLILRYLNSLSTQWVRQMEKTAGVAK